MNDTAAHAPGRWRPILTAFIAAGAAMLSVVAWHAESSSAGADERVPSMAVVSGVGENFPAGLQGAIGGDLNPDPSAQRVDLPGLDRLTALPR
jgi:hypothetical protein